MNFPQSISGGAGKFLAISLVLCLWGAWGALSLRGLFKRPCAREVGYKIGLSDFLLLAFLSATTLWLSSQCSLALGRFCDSDALLTYGGTACMNVLFIASACIFLKFSESKPRLFCRGANSVGALVSGGFEMFKNFALLAGIAALWLSLLSLLDMDVKEQAAVEFFVDLNSIWLKIAAIFTLAVLAPVWEEIFFRGFIYGALKGLCGTLAAALATSVFFALIHASLYAFLPIFFLSLFFILLYEKSGDLRVSMGAHSLFNLCNAVGLIIQARQNG